MHNKYFSLLFASFMLLFMYPVHATTHIVNAQGTTIPTDIYVPDIVNAEVGDTIKWVWISGYHTTESTNIPAGASPWAANLDNSDTTFSYVVTEVGTYEYTCHKIAPHGMDGTINVSAKTTTGISSLDATSATMVYPNPFSDMIHIANPNAETIEVFNLAGERVKVVSVGHGQAEVEIDMSGSTNGIYIYSIIKDGASIKTGKLLKN